MNPLTKEQLQLLKSADIETRCRCPKPCVRHSSHYRAEYLELARRRKVAGAVHKLVNRYGPVDINDSTQVQPFIERIFRHGLEVGMWVSHTANIPMIMDQFRMGTLPETMKELTLMEAKERDV